MTIYADIIAEARCSTAVHFRSDTGTQSIQYDARPAGSVLEGGLIAEFDNPNINVNTMMMREMRCTPDADDIYRFFRDVGDNSLIGGVDFTDDVGWDTGALSAQGPRTYLLFVDITTDDYFILRLSDVTSRGGGFLNVQQTDYNVFIASSFPAFSDFSAQSDDVRNSVTQHELIFATFQLVNDSDVMTFRPTFTTVPSAHAVDAGSISHAWALVQPTVSHSSRTTNTHAVDAGGIQWAFSIPRPTVSRRTQSGVDAGPIGWSFDLPQPRVSAHYRVDAGGIAHVWSIRVVDPRLFSVQIIRNNVIPGSMDDDWHRDGRVHCESPMQPVTVTINVAPEQVRQLHDNQLDLVEDEFRRRLWPLGVYYSKEAGAYSGGSEVRITYSGGEAISTIPVSVLRNAAAVAGWATRTALRNLLGDSPATLDISEGSFEASSEMAFAGNGGQLDLTIQYVEVA